MFKFFGKKSAVKDNKIDTSLISVDVDGEQVPLSTLMNSLSNEGDEKIEVLHEADSVKVNGKEVKIGDLVTAYKNAKAKNNGEEEKCNKCGEKKHEGECDPEKKNAFEKVKEDAKKNADEELKKKEEENKKNEEEKKKKEEELKNSKDNKAAEEAKFLELANARQDAAKENAGPAGAETREDRARRGKKLFGKNKK